MNTRVRYQVSLELGNINIQSTIKTKRCGQGGDNLSNESVQVGVCWPFNVKIPSTNIVKSFIIKAESTIGVLKKRMRREYGVVRLYNSSGNLGRRRDSEGKLGLPSVIDGQSLEKKRSETGTGSSPSCVEYEESLKTSTIVCKLADAVEYQVNNFLKFLKELIGW